MLFIDYSRRKGSAFYQYSKKSKFFCQNITSPYRNHSNLIFAQLISNVYFCGGFQTIKKICQYIHNHRVRRRKQ